MRKRTAYFKSFLSVVLMMAVLLMMTPVWEKMVDSADNSDEYAVMPLAAPAPFNGYDDTVTGSGAPGDPYKITTAEQLWNLAAYVNEGNQCKDTYFELTDTINLGCDSSKPWTPIGDTAHKFSGTFYGSEGKKITINRLYIEVYDMDAPQGLFGYVEGGTIANLTVSGDVISHYSGSANGESDQTNKGKYVGGVVGYNKDGTITNCVNRVNVIGERNYTGGVVGYNKNSKNATITGCTNEAEVRGGVNYTGGIAGYNESCPLDDCHNNGAISGDTNIGGIVGGNNGGTITNCTNNEDAVVTSTGNMAGGIVGENTKSGEVNSCQNYGTVSGGGNYTGGIVGKNGNLKDKLSGTVLECDNYGTVSGENDVGGIVGGIEVGTIKVCTNYSDSKVTANKDRIGGIAGSNGGIIERCANKSDISVTVGYVGGIVGKNISVDSKGNTGVGTVSVCQNDGKVSGGSNVGGIAGANDIGTITGYTNDANVSPAEQRCINNAAVSGSSNVGGIAGSNSGTIQDRCINFAAVNGAGSVGGVVGDNSGTVEVCYNTGNVTGTGNDVGGVVGNNGSGGDVHICYSIGKEIKGADNVGGVAGNNQAPMQNCYNTGEVKGNASVGGIVGNNKSTVDKCYNVGKVNEIYGGAIGSDNGTTTNCFYFTTHPNEGDGSSGSVTAKNADGFANDETFTDVQWKFNNDHTLDWEMGFTDEENEPVRPILSQIPEHPLDPLPRVTHTVTFDYQYDDVDETTAEYAPGEKYGELPTPEAREGYEFKGWYTSPDGTGKQITSEDTVEGDTRLYAHWEEKTDNDDEGNSNGDDDDDDDDNGGNGNGGNNNDNGNNGNDDSNGGSEPSPDVTEPSDSTVPGDVNVGTESGENAPDVTISEESSGKLKEEVINEHLTDEDKSALEGGDNIDIILRVEDAEDTVPDEDRQAAEEAAADTGFTVGGYLEADLIKRRNGVEVGKITETNSPISVTIEIPEELRKSNRDFVIVRIINGVAEILEDIDDDPDTITILTDRFSVYYSIAYKDPKPANPSTGSHVTIIALAIAVSAAAVTFRRNKIIE